MECLGYSKEPSKTWASFNAMRQLRGPEDPMQCVAVHGAHLLGKRIWSQWTVKRGTWAYEQLTPTNISTKIFLGCWIAIKGQGASPPWQERMPMIATGDHATTPALPPHRILRVGGRANTLRGNQLTWEWQVELSRTSLPSHRITPSLSSQCGPSPKGWVILSMTIV